MSVLLDSFLFTLWSLFCFFCSLWLLLVHLSSFWACFYCHHAASVFSFNSFLSALLAGCHLPISPLFISIPSSPSRLFLLLHSLFLWWVYGGEDVPLVVPQCTSAHPPRRLLDCDWLVWSLRSLAVSNPGVFINPTLCSHCFVIGCRKKSFF